MKLVVLVTRIDKESEWGEYCIGECGCRFFQNDGSAEFNLLLLRGETMQGKDNVNVAKNIFGKIQDVIEGLQFSRILLAYHYEKDLTKALRKNCPQPLIENDNLCIVKYSSLDNNNIFRHITGIKDSVCSKNVPDVYKAAEALFNECCY